MPVLQTAVRAAGRTFTGFFHVFRHWAQRFRDAILRPHRADLALLRAAIDSLGEGQARQRTELAILNAAADDLTERQVSAMRDITRGLHDLEIRLTTQTTKTHEFAAIVAEEQDRLRVRDFLIEQLLTGTSAARPPGARRAVAEFATPTVSVILPTYERAAFVVEAIASVQAQSFQDWELIVVDDESCDATAEAVAPFLADRRIRYVRQAHAGGSVARNRGLAETTAPLVAYLDSDNLWYPDFLARAVDHLATETDVDLVYGALVSEFHRLDRSRILWSPFNRDDLLAGNFIDTNVIVHRRTLVTRFGGWDPDIERLADWDLVLRYTEEKPGRPVAVLAAYYRVCDDRRLTEVVPFWPDEVAVRRKWFPPRAVTRRPRVLYVVWHYPQLSESYVESELRCMQQWGIDVELWRTGVGPSPYPTSVPIHDGTLAAAIEKARPDVVHVHWLGFAIGQQADLAAAKLPVTLRLHGFDTTREGLAALLAHDWVKAVYAFPNQIARFGLTDARLKPIPVAFDTKLFKPRAERDPHLVVRTAAALPSKDLELFFEAARRLPQFRFVLAAVTCAHREEYVDHLRAIREQIGSPAEISLDLPRESIADLVGRAGIYVHTMRPPGDENATPVGQPISIAEAMASGCYCLVRDVPDLAALVGSAGATYRDLEDLVHLIRATEEWPRATWLNVRRNAIEIAYRHHADATVLQTLFNDWIKLSQP